MIDHAAISAGDAFLFKGLPNAGCDSREPTNLFDVDGFGMLLHEEEPVPTPGNVACNGTDFVEWQCDVTLETIGGNVPYPDPAIVVQRGNHVADGRLDEVFANVELSEVTQGGDHADHAMPAHME